MVLRDTVRQPAQVPLPGASSTSRWQRWEKISSLTTHKEQLPSKSFPFSESQGSGIAFPNKSLRDVVLPPEQGAGEAHGSQSPGAHTVHGSREMLQTQVGSLSSEKSHAAAVPTVLPHLNSTATKREHLRAEEFTYHRHPAFPRASLC